MEIETIREAVRKRYARAIMDKKGCCGGETQGGCCGNGDKAATGLITGGIYGQGEIEGLPAGLLESSFGCGNPAMLADLHPGETVLDLGSGAGLDVLLSARRVGPYGKAYGLDMTGEMLREAKKNQEKAGIKNVEFLQGYIEEIPLPDNSVDVVISNCVINLSGDKGKVIREAFRVLKPGGRFAVSDIVLKRPLPPEALQDLERWTSCIAGALLEDEYRKHLLEAGFRDVEITVTREYDFAGNLAGTNAARFYKGDWSELSGTVVSAFVKAKKPAMVLCAGRDYLIRPASGEDFDDVCSLLADAGLTAAGIDRENISNYLVGDITGIAGVIGLERAGDAALLRSLAVRPEWRKAGLGAALVEEALRKAKEAGCREVYLLTATAGRYMERWGFAGTTLADAPTKLLEGSALSTACPATSLCMKLVLD
ncbi:MAG: arsenite methyltransferase [Peptococcaceae bacterium]|jgi:ubiquinone/menaquinone biosynthesis C-methylase UbiE/N-acetylglutamate synthase-like GNAT family acetyltransferase|nr:arsenite methyltransferase [Peptococcaceae bacterium]MDH7525058.1 arsenite methyltransferase [Peptococcaceae bacterium]